MITVLHTESSKGWGGQEQRTLRESVGLSKLGCRVIILCPPDAELGRRGEAAGIKVRHCSMSGTYDMFAMRRIMKVIHQERVDVVNTHSGRDSFLAGLAGRLSRRKPVVIRTRHLALPISSKFTYSVFPHKVVTVSEYVKQYLISEGVSPAQVVSIPTGIDLTRFDPHATSTALRQELGVDDRTPLIGTVAVLRIKKGHQVLLTAIPKILQRFPDAKFVFAGDGPQRENIRNRIEDLDLTGKVVMLGARNDVPAILKDIDLFVLPTQQEALGTSFLEAMAMGKPVIGSSVDGVGEVIKDGENGYLVEPESPGALAEKIEDLLADETKAAQMGETGRRMVLDGFTVERMCDRMLALYKELLAARAL